MAYSAVATLVPVSGFRLLLRFIPASYFKSSFDSGVSKRVLFKCPKRGVLDNAIFISVKADIKHNVRR